MLAMFTTHFWLMFFSVLGRHRRLLSTCCLLHLWADDHEGFQAHIFITNAFPAFRAQAVSNLQPSGACALRPFVQEPFQAYIYLGLVLPSHYRLIHCRIFGLLGLLLRSHCRLIFFLAFRGSYFEAIAGSYVFGLLGLLLPSHFRLIFLLAFRGSCFEAISGSYIFWPSGARASTPFQAHIFLAFWASCFEAIAGSYFFRHSGARASKPFQAHNSPSFGAQAFKPFHAHISSGLLGLVL